MSLIALILSLAIAGFLCWLVLQIPMPQPFRNVIIGVIIFILILWVLQALGVNTGLSRIRIN
jgi:hypothetical protein